MTRQGALVIAAVAVFVSGCGFVSGRPISGSTIDGWPIGQPLDCGVGRNRLPECDEFIPAAVVGFDRRDPGHVPIANTTLYGQGDGLGNTVLLTCSGGCPVIAVFQLVDGTVRAIGVGTPGVSTEAMTFDYGPKAFP